MRKQAILNAIALAGIGCSLYAGYRLYRNWSFVDSAKRATALVTHLERRLDEGETAFHDRDRVDRHSRSCIETIVFTTDAHEKVVWQSPISTTYSTGDGASERMIVPDDRERQVLYNPANPRHFEYASTGALWWQWSLLMVLGGGLVYLALGGLETIARLLGASLYGSTAMAREDEAPPVATGASAERYRLR